MKKAKKKSTTKSKAKNKVTKDMYYVLLGILAFVIIGLLIFYANQTNADIDTVGKTYQYGIPKEIEMGECVDTDSQNQFVKGEVYLDGNLYDVDKCEDSFVWENYCGLERMPDGTFYIKPWQRKVRCSYGCEDGACYKP